MAEVKYNLRDKKAKNKTLIVLVFNYGTNRVKVSTGRSVPPKFWNNKKHRVKELMEYSDYKNTNDLLDTLEAIMLNTYKKYRDGGYIPESKILKTAFLNAQNSPIITKTNKSCWDHFNEFVDDKVDELGYVVDYDKALRKHLEEVEKIYDLPLSFESLKDQTKYGIPRRMRKYLETKAINAKGRIGFTKNTIGKQNKNLKVFLNWSFDNGKYPKFSLKHIPTLSNKVENVFLNSKELDKLEKLILTSKNENIVRDLFLIGCETGMRYSDLVSIKKEDIRGEDLYVEPIKTKNIKERNLLIIPIKDRLLRILKKYNFTPPNYTRKKGTEFNNLIREICYKAKINEPIIKNRQEGNKIIKETHKKYELISSHTCRRSFCSIKFHEKKLPTHVIMQFSGHTTEKSFLRYLDVSAQTIANKYREKF